jgi:hypothetical protein
MDKNISNDFVTILNTKLEMLIMSHYVSSCFLPIRHDTISVQWQLFVYLMDDIYTDLHCHFLNMKRYF